MIIDPQNVASRKGSIYPKQFQPLVSGRVKQRLGDAAGLKNFGVNLVTLEPGSRSALRHWHSHQDEFIYVIEGEVTLVTDAGAQVLKPGMMAGFPAGEADGHHLINQTSKVVTYLEVGDRTPDDEVTYPDHDLIAKPGLNERMFMREDGTLYD